MLFDRSRRRILAAGLAAALCGPAVAQTPLLASTAPDRAPKLVAAAKAEGSFTLYTSIAQKDLDTFVQPFEKKYGVKVNVWRASGDTVLQRVINEANAKRYAVDSVHIGAKEMEALAREGLLQPVVSPYDADLIDGAVRPNHLWVNTLLSVWVQPYNTGAVKKADLPKTYRDLLDPKWKGKLGYEVENVEWFATVVNSMGEAPGLKFFRDLVATNGVSIRKGHTQLNNMVISGEVPFALTVYNYMPEQAKRKGAPIDWTVLQPAVARGNGMGVTKNAPKPNAAALFQDFMLSEGQSLMSTIDYVPTSKKVASPLKDVKIILIDPAESLDKQQKWDKLYKEIMLNKAR
jgi:iron(III) transport system substrate-binding protein